MDIRILKNAVAAAAFLFVGNQTFAEDLKQLLPQNNAISGWKLTDSSTLYVGNQIYNYIDGGAEIFMEYGFKQVISASYRDSSGHQLQVEIYEMEDAYAAYGSYTFYLNGVGTKIDAGSEAVLIDYYAVSWKGNLLVVVSTPAADSTLNPILKDFLAAISLKYNQISSKPDLVRLFENKLSTTSYIKYIEGKVGLSNIYKFIPGNAFTFKKAISFDFNETKIIVFQYHDSVEAIKNHQLALQKLRDSNKDTEFRVSSTTFSYIDYKNNNICCQQFGNYLLVTIGKDIEKQKESLLKVQPVLINHR